MEYPKEMWAGFDWKQAELFMLSLFSGDGKLREALESSDVHCYNASLIFSIDEVEKEQRDLAKTVSFALIYSGFDKNIAKVTIQRDWPSLGEEEIEEAIDKFLENYFILNNWIREVILDWYDNDGWVSYFMGARKHIPVPGYLDRDVDKLLGSHEGRTAINTYGQNSVGLLLKSVFSGIKRNEKLRGNLSHFVPMFDNLTFVTNSECLAYSIEEVESLATPVLNFNGFKIRMRTDWKLSDKSWGEMKDIKVEGRDIEYEYSW